MLILDKVIFLEKNSKIPLKIEKLKKKNSLIKNSYYNKLNLTNKKNLKKNKKMKDWKNKFNKKSNMMLLEKLNF